MFRTGGVSFMIMLLICFFSFLIKSKPAQVCGKKGLEVEVECEQDYASVPEQQANEKLLEDSYLVDSKLHEPAVSS